MPLKKDLSKTLDKSILIQNDANCFALAETLLGSVNDQYPHAKNVFGIIIGTGVGGGVIINGKTVYGSQGIGGEWGHTIVTDNGDECYCGKRGCVETVISGRALQTYYKNISGRELKFEEIYATKDNDKYAKETFERLITYFGKGLSNVVNIIDPEVIVLGGGVIIDGKTVYGSQGIGGEWGHTIVTDIGDECYCGKRGCVESVISGRALQIYYDKISGKKLKFEEIYALKDTDKHANETFKRLITHFGKGLSNVVNIIDPEVIVLGGGLSNIDELYTDGYNELKKYVFNPTFNTPILRPKLGDSAGVYGAALL